MCLYIFRGHVYICLYIYTHIYNNVRVDEILDTESVSSICGLVTFYDAYGIGMTISEIIPSLEDTLY